ncbi:redoxin domain-containing protein [Tenacibaculum agarivorans]|uniref:redoxin domain-containing protein n=1 Tax=Tenacibaculum agarivorans TaxID=1908389 RepID=UPI00094BA6C9|nr:redoxin domain-containing protein [Tenacibaculum agarivorans]
MKNLLKSTFVTLLPTVALIILIRTLILFQLNNKTISLLLSSIPIVLFFSLLFIKPVARTSPNLIGYTTPMFIGFFFALYTKDITTIIASAILVLGWLTYLFWYSKFEKRNTHIIQVGKTLPELIFDTSDKEETSITDYQSDFKVLLFYRGNWCPLCMAQIKEIANEYKELTKRNTEVFLISSQPHHFTESLAKKHNVPFHFLVDIENKNADKLQLLHKNGLPMGFQVLGYESDVVLPTVIITDKTNKIIYADLTDNYRVRPEPATFLKIIDEHIS